MAIENGQALLRVSKEFGAPAHTLWRHRDSKVVTLGEVYLGRHHPAQSPAIEKAVHDHDDHIKYMEKCLFGLSTRDVRRLMWRRKRE